MEDIGLYQITETYNLTLSCEELGFFPPPIERTDYWTYDNSNPNVVLFQIDDMWIDSYIYNVFPNDTFDIIDIQPTNRPGQTSDIYIKAFRDIAAGETIQASVDVYAIWHKNSSISSIGNIGDTVSGLADIYNLRLLTSQQFKEVLECAELKYILVQVILHPDLTDIEEIELNRMIELARAGKRIVIQLWFGPARQYNWSYCSYPNIAMQQEVREYLFENIDKTIDKIGHENIYGVHLLEEDSQYGVDIDQPGYWWKNKGWVYSGYEDGYPSNNSANLGKLYGGQTAWNCQVPNINQYNSFFKAETNLDMNNLASDDLSYPVLDRWMAKRLWAGAHRKFLQHIKEKYPNIKRFIWGHQSYDENCTAIDALSDIVDGVIVNPYDDTLGMHHWFSGIRELLPKSEFLVILKDSLDTELKDIRVATAYLNGASAIGFFDTLAKQETWQTSQNIWKKISELPILRATQPKVLIINNNTFSGPSTGKKMLPFFKLPTVIYTRDAAGINLSQYKIIVLHYGNSFRNDLSLLNYNMTGYGPDDNQLKNWVKSGGILVVTSPNFLEDNQFFISKEPIAWIEITDKGNDTEPGNFCCYFNIANKYNIKQCYYDMVAWQNQIVWGDGISHDNLPIGGVTEYGSGLIVILPIFHNDNVLLDKQISDEYKVQCYKDMAYYIADVIRGVAMFHDPTGLWANEIVSQSEPFGLLLDDENNDIKVKVIFDIFNQDFSCNIYKGGNLILGK
jgi:hypothetical protein